MTTHLDHAPTLDVMPEPTEPGAVVNCTVNGHPARAMLADDDLWPWIVAYLDNSHDPTAEWRAWDALDNPTPYQEAH